MRIIFVAALSLFLLNINGANASFITDFFTTIKEKIFGNENDVSAEKINDQIEKEDQEIQRDEEKQKTLKHKLKTIPRHKIIQK